MPKHDRLLSIYEKTATQDDSGAEVITWVLVDTVWAEVAQVRGLERWSSQQMKASVDSKFKIRYRSDVTPLNMITVEGRTYDIFSVIELGRRKELEILATARAESPGTIAGAVVTITTEHDLNQAEDTRTLFTVADGDVVVEYLGVIIPEDLTLAEEDFTGISIQSTCAIPVVFVSASAGAKANLAAGKMIPYSTPKILSEGSLIQLSILGASPEVECVATVFVSYRSISDGILVV
jgi:SPP1 family predicted phage head-tail adaptor